MNDPFASSDSLRSAQPLRHLQRLRLEAPLRLEAGGKLENVEVAYETWGVLDADRSNAVLVGHALSGDSHVARHGPGDDPGWWDAMVGPGRPIDTGRWYVVCANLLGGCRGSTGPASPGLGLSRDGAFPEIRVGDMVECQRQLLDHLGITRARAVIGGSLGGHQVLDWATRFPDRVECAIALATSLRLTPQATALDVAGREAIAAGDAAAGLAVARMLGHISYLSPRAMEERVRGDRLESIHRYLRHQGARFVERFDPESYRVLSLAMDRFDLPREALARARCRWLVVSFSSDWLFPPAQSRELVRELVALGQPVTSISETTDSGHDAFLLESDIRGYGARVRDLLEGPPRACAPRASAPGPGPGPGPEWAEARALEWIAPGTHVLQIGPATRSGLASLRARGADRLLACASDPARIAESARLGIDAVQLEPLELLEALPGQSFDWILLADALEIEPSAEGLLDAALRVARRVVVSASREAPCSTARPTLSAPLRRALSPDDLETYTRRSRARVETCLRQPGTGRWVATLTSPSAGPRR